MFANSFIRSLNCTLSATMSSIGTLESDVNQRWQMQACRHSVISEDDLSANRTVAGALKSVLQAVTASG